MVYDFHTHSSLSDGVLSPIELIRRAHVNGYRVIAITDHASPGIMERIIEENVRVCALASKQWDILSLPGVELTHVPVGAIAESALQAKKLGAQIVVVHGETIAEPVEPGTNRAALESPDVDILAHPGLLTLEEAELAAHTGKFLEISARKGHCLTNGLVAQLAQQAGANLLLNSDSHCEDDLLTDDRVQKILRGSGLDKQLCAIIAETNPQALLKKLPGTGITA